MFVDHYLIVMDIIFNINSNFITNNNVNFKKKNYFLMIILHHFIMLLTLIESWDVTLEQCYFFHSYKYKVQWVVNF
jgi:hypothetical protein